MPSYSQMRHLHLQLLSTYLLSSLLISLLQWPPHQSSSSLSRLATSLSSTASSWHLLLDSAPTTSTSMVRSVSSIILKGRARQGHSSSQRPPLSLPRLANTPMSRESIRTTRSQHGKRFVSPPLATIIPQRFAYRFSCCRSPMPFTPRDLSSISSSGHWVGRLTQTFSRAKGTNLSLHLLFQCPADPHPGR